MPDLTESRTPARQVRAGVDNEKSGFKACKSP